MNNVCVFAVSVTVLSFLSSHEGLIFFHVYVLSPCPPGVVLAFSLVVVLPPLVPASLEPGLFPLPAAISPGSGLSPHVSLECGPCPISLGLPCPYLHWTVQGHLPNTLLTLDHQLSN